MNLECERSENAFEIGGGKVGCIYHTLVYVCLCECERQVNYFWMSDLANIVSEW